MEASNGCEGASCERAEFHPDCSVEGTPYPLSGKLNSLGKVCLCFKDGNPRD